MYKNTLYLNLLFVSMFSSLLTYGNEINSIVFKESEGEYFNAVTVSPDGKMIAASSNYKMVIWDIESQKIINTFVGIVQPTYIEFSPDNQYIVACGLSMRANIWNIKTGEIIFSVQQNGDVTSPLIKSTFSSDGKKLIILGEFFEIWDIQQQKRIHDFTKIFYIGSENSVYALTDSNYLLLNEWITEPPHSIISIIDIENSKRFKTIFEGSLTYNLLSCNKNFLVYISEPKDTFRQDLIVYDIANDKEIFRKSFANYISEKISINNEGSFFITEDFENHQYLQIYDINKNKTLRTIEVDQYTAPHGQSENDTFGEIIIFPDGTKFLTANMYQITLWDISDLTSSNQEATDLKQ